MERLRQDLHRTPLLSYRLRLPGRGPNCRGRDRCRLSALEALADPLSPKKLQHVRLHCERCHRRNLAQIPVSGELLEHAVRKVCPGGKSPFYVLFGHLIISDGFRLKETRGPDNRPVKITVHHERFHSFQICIRRPPKSGENERLHDCVKDETSPIIMVSTGST